MTDVPLAPPPLVQHGSDHTKLTDDLENGIKAQLTPLAAALKMPENIEVRPGDRMVGEGDLEKIMTSSPGDQSVSLDDLKEDYFPGTVRVNSSKKGAKEWFKRHLAMKFSKKGDQN